MLVLSKTWNPDDLQQIPDALAAVNQVGIDGQAECRRWEYAVAIEAFTRWGGRGSHEVMDVGGGGSPFWKMIGVDRAHVVDPREGGQSLANYLTGRPRLMDAVFCLSVVEHVAEADLDQFLYHLACLVRPGGLLFLTMDCCPCPLDHHQQRPERHHFHWMRERTFTRGARADLLATLAGHQCQPFGEIDWQYYGDLENWGYSVCSLALVKRA